MALPQREKPTGSRAIRRGLGKEADVAKFHHVGVPTKKQQRGETYLEGARGHITNPLSSAGRF
jgi:hypothetical protein